MGIHHWYIQLQWESTSYNNNGQSRLAIEDRQAVLSIYLSIYLSDYLPFLFWKKYENFWNKFKKFGRKIKKFERNSKIFGRSPKIFGRNSINLEEIQKIWKKI